MLGHERAFPTLSIIIVNRNTLDYLEKCLNSIFNSEFRDYEVIVVDNGSVDGSAEHIRRIFPHVGLIASEANLGYAMGNNLGASRAGGKYLLFLNSDVEVGTDLLETLVRVMESDNSIGALGSKVILDKEKKLIDCIGGFDCDNFGYGLRPVGHGEVDHGQYDNRTEVFGVAGMCFMTRKAIFELVGGFDSSFFLLVEDIDLSWRIRLCGYKVAVEPSAMVYHKSQGTFKREKVRRDYIRYLAERNTLRMLMKNYSISSLLTLLPKYFSLLGAETLFYLSRGKTGLAIANLRAVCWNIRQQDTFSRRGYVQRLRRLTDEKIKQGMINGSLKIDMLRSYISGNFKF
jgi:GT2 family glycosyltransferase